MHYYIYFFATIVLYKFYDFTDSYIRKPNTYCNGFLSIEKYDTLSMGIQKCSDNYECTSITDYKCNGGFWTCKSTILIDASGSMQPGSCSWQKKPKGISIIIYFSKHCVEKLIVKLQCSISFLKYR